MEGIGMQNSERQACVWPLLTTACTTQRIYCRSCCNDFIQHQFGQRMTSHLATATGLKAVADARQKSHQASAALFPNPEKLWESFPGASVEDGAGSLAVSLDFGPTLFGSAGSSARKREPLPDQLSAKRLCRQNAMLGEKRWSQAEEKSMGE